MSDGREAGLRATIHRLLWRGMAASVSLMAWGLLAHAARSPTGLRLINAGILLLILTPVARVAALFWGFASEKEWPFAAASAGVLVLLLTSLLLGVRR